MNFIFSGKHSIYKDDCKFTRETQCSVETRRGEGTSLLSALSPEEAGLNQGLGGENSAGSGQPEQSHGWGEGPYLYSLDGTTGGLNSIGSSTVKGQDWFGDCG